jgi:hypothetical protein
VGAKRHPLADKAYALFITDFSSAEINPWQRRYGFFFVDAKLIQMAIG